MAETKNDSPSLIVKTPFGAENIKLDSNRKDPLYSLYLSCRDVLGVPTGFQSLLEDFALWVAGGFCYFSILNMTRKLIIGLAIAHATPMYVVSGAVLLVALNLMLLWLILFGIQKCSAPYLNGGLKLLFLVVAGVVFVL